MTDWEEALLIRVEPEPTPIYDQLKREQRDALMARLGFKEVKK